MPVKPDEKEPAVVIYTDGGCEPNPGTGGWGAVLLYGDHVKELSGGAPDTTADNSKGCPV